MTEIINKILDKFGKSLVVVIGKIATAVIELSRYLSKRQEIKQEKEEKREEAAKQKSIEDACDKGTLDDLFNSVSKGSAILLTLCLCGCMSVKIQPTKPWEGHYMTVKDFQEKTENIQLSRGESIWVISNNTMKRLLLENRKEK